MEDGKQIPHKFQLICAVRFHCVKVFIPKGTATLVDKRGLPPIDFEILHPKLTAPFLLEQFDISVMLIGMHHVMHSPVTVVRFEF